MSKALTIGLALAVGVVAGVVGAQMMNPAAQNAPVEAKTDAPLPTHLSSVPGAVGSQDVSGPYDVAKDWPQNLATLPGHEKWTYGGARGVFAESPDRVFLLGGGELPNIERPQNRFLTDVGPNVLFPVGGLPWRNANQATPPGNGGSRQDAAKGMEAWRGKQAPFRELDRDARWHHSIIVVNREGKIIEDWTQWDNMFKRPHAVYISPYDAEKRVWIVDDHTHAIYIFTNDGKQHLQTIGTPNMPGADATHFNRPTFIAWAPDATFYVADGYNGTRVAKFDKDGKFMFDFGQPGEPGNETRPGYMNNVHGVAVDIKTGNVFVNDRDNHRIQVFDADGKYLREWKIDANPSSLHFIQIGDDGHAVVFDRNTHKLVKYDLDGRLIYSWGTIGDFPGTIWGVHGMATDQEGNLYLAEVDSGRFQKFTPRPGANPATLAGKPIYSAWK